MLKKITFLILGLQALSIIHLLPAQKVLEFNDVKLIQGSFLVPANTSTPTTPPKDTVIVVPVGKVWHIQSMHMGFSPAPFSKVSGTGTVLQVAVDDVYVPSGSYGDEDFIPFWLPAGSYHLKYHLNGGGTLPYASYYKFSMSAIEYSTTP